jgi:hypothetical protein
MTVKEIVKEYLEEKGFDGLVNTDIECGCDKDTLFPCESTCENCSPAYKHVEIIGGEETDVYTEHREDAE